MSAFLAAAAILGQSATPAWPAIERPTADPLVMPLVYYTRFIYQFPPDASGGEAGRTSLKKLEWNGVEIAIPPGTQSIDAWWIRAAYGMRSWGIKLKQPSWVANADAMMNAVVAAGVLDGSGPSSGPNGLAIQKGDDGFGAVFAAIYAGSFRDYSGADKLLTQLSRWAEAASRQRAPLTPSETGGLVAFRIWNPTNPASSGITKELIEASLRRFSGNKDQTPEQLLDEAGAFGLAALMTANPAHAEEARSLARRAAARQISDPALDSAPFSSFGFFNDRRTRVPYEAWHAFTLMDLAASEPTPDLFRRGVAMLRANLALLNVPSNSLNQLEYGDLRPGAMAGVPWAFAAQQAASAPGFTRGEGQLMTTLYFVDARFGSHFTSKAGWSAEIDGIRKAKDGWENLFRLNPVPFQGPATFAVVGADGKRTDISSTQHPMAIRAMGLRRENGRVIVVAEPAFQQTKDNPLRPSGRFIFGDGSVKTARLGDSGFEAEASQRVLLSGPVRFVGQAGGRAMAFGPLKLDTFLPPASEWKGTFSFAGASGADLEVSTSQAGRGVMQSPAFLLTTPVLTFETLALGQGASVQLADADTGALLVRLSAPWSPASPPRKTRWDLTPFLGRTVRMQIVDQSSTAGATIRLAPIQAQAH